MPGWKGAAIPAWVNLIKPLVILALLGGAGYWIVTKKLKSDAEEASKPAEAEQKPGQTRIRRAGPVSPDFPAPVRAKAKPARTETPDPARKPATARPADPAAPVAPATPATPEVNENDLAAGLERSTQLVKESRYGTAQGLLRELEKGHTGKEWWTKHEKNWTEAYAKVKQQLKELEDEVHIVKGKEEELKYERAKVEFYLDLMGHDIGNLHQGISSGLELARRSESDSRSREMALGIAYENVHRSIALVKNIQVLSRLGISEKALEQMDLTRSVQSSYRNIHHMFPNRKVKVILTEKDHSLKVMAEPLLDPHGPRHCECCDRRRGHDDKDRPENDEPLPVPGLHQGLSPPRRSGFTLPI
jgi:hypothetical protein